MINLTKKMLHDTFIELIDQGGNAKLTVKELTERCGMSRNTFYYYYESIQSLMNEVMREWFDTPAPKKCETPFDCIEPLMQRCLENRSRILYIRQTDYRRLMRDILTELTARNVKVYVAGLEKNGTPIEDEAFFTSFFVRVLMSFVSYWIHKGLGKTTDIRNFSHLLGDAFDGLAMLKRERESAPVSADDGRDQKKNPNDDRYP